MKKPYKLFQNILLESAAGYDPSTYVMAKALVALTESEMNEISTNDEITNKFMKHVSEPHVEIYNRSVTSGIAPYGQALTSYVNRKDNMNGFEKNLVLCKFWDDNIPREFEYTDRYPNSCLSAVKSIKEKNPEISGKIAPLEKCVSNAVDTYKSMDLYELPRKNVEESILTESVDQISFEKINSYMESHLDNDAMNAYNRTIFYVPFIESFSDHVDTVMRSSMCKNKNYVASAIATAVYEAVANNVIDSINGESILQNINEMTLNEFAIGSMMPVVGLTPSLEQKVEKTPVDRFEKITKDTYTDEIKNGVKTAASEFADYSRRLYTEGYIKNHFCDDICAFFEGLFDSPDMKKAIKSSCHTEYAEVFPPVGKTFDNNSALMLGLVMADKGVEPGSDLAIAYENCFGSNYNKILKIYIEAVEEKANPIFVVEARKMWDKLFKWMNIDDKNRDSEFNNSLGKGKFNLTIKFKDTSDVAANAIKTVINGNGYKRISDNDPFTTEKYIKGIHIISHYIQSKGRLFLRYEEGENIVKKSANNDSVLDNRQKIIDIAMNVFSKNGFEPKASEKEIKCWINGEYSESDSICICNLGNSMSKISKCCGIINKELKKYNAKITPDNYGTAFIKCKDELITESGKASMDEDMIEPCNQLNSRGYKVKYSCAGHYGTTVKEDRNKDLVKYGKLYSTARITFKKGIKLMTIPSNRWMKKIMDDGSESIYVKPITYNNKYGTPAQAFAKWKEAYMTDLISWIDQLPDYGEREDIFESVTLDSLYFDMYYR